ncbi:transcription factor mef2A-like [Teleopsis dalmanni]|uniref:transcription factor mef2A-like n=1 Tax=Teleopsis dalmanni TaxID=139649 RepID=UPI0018CD54C6|nr:transcription factor mef2A-like [Teleopsis dalmanni]
MSTIWTTTNSGLENGLGAQLKALSYQVRSNNNRAHINNNNKVDNSNTGVHHTPSGASSSSSSHSHLQQTSVLPTHLSSNIITVATGQHSNPYYNNNNNNGGNNIQHRQSISHSLPQYTQQNSKWSCFVAATFSHYTLVLCEILITRCFQYSWPSIQVEQQQCKALCFCNSRLSCLRF